MQEMQVRALGREEDSPGERNGLPTPVFFPEESHGQRSLLVYSPQSYTDLDITEAI